MADRDGGGGNALADRNNVSPTSSWWCTCGRSYEKPWCDRSHRQDGRAGDGDPGYSGPAGLHAVMPD